MNKFKNYTVIYVAVLMFSTIGCQSGPDLSEPPNVGGVDNLSSFKVNEDLAKEIALGFFSNDSNFIAGRKGKRFPKIREIARISFADSINFEAFIINEMEGFVLISGDSRIMPILAYSSEGKLTLERLQDVNGLKVWYQEAIKQISRELKEIESVHPIVYDEWKKYAQKFDPKGRIWDKEVAYSYNSNCYEWYQYGQHMCNPYMRVYERQPLYSNQISWGQSGLSNYYAPSNSNCSCYKSPIGCGPVAIAQTLWYFKPGNYLYSSMPQYSNMSCNPTNSGETSLANLMISSAIAANTSLNYYGCNGMTYPWKISSALESMGLQSGGSTSKINYSHLNIELYKGYPTIFYGRDNLLEWHIWTCDGFKQHNYKAYDCDKDGCVEWSYTWYYMNWGWNNSDLDPNDNDSRTSNGYYSLGSYSPYGSSNNYDNNLRMITGLR